MLIVYDVSHKSRAPMRCNNLGDRPAHTRPELYRWVPRLSVAFITCIAFIYIQSRVDAISSCVTHALIAFHSGRSHVIADGGTLNGIKWRKKKEKKSVDGAVTSCRRHVSRNWFITLLFSFYVRTLAHTSTSGRWINMHDNGASSNPKWLMANLQFRIEHRATDNSSATSAAVASAGKECFVHKRKPSVICIPIATVAAQWRISIFVSCERACILKSLDVTSADTFGARANG